MSNNLLFEDIFEVLVVDPDGKRFDKGMHLHQCLDRAISIQELLNFFKRVIEY